MGLNHSSENVLRAVATNKPYHSDAIVKAGQPLWLETINNSKGIYHALYHKHKYYYANGYDKCNSFAEPYAADYYKGSFDSTAKPWKYKYIVLNRKHKIHNGSDWTYNYDNDTKMSDYRYRNGHWHNTGLGDDSPDLIN